MVWIYEWISLIKVLNKLWYQYYADNDEDKNPISTCTTSQWRHVLWVKSLDANFHYWIIKTHQCVTLFSSSALEALLLNPPDYRLADFTSRTRLLDIVSCGVNVVVVDERLFAFYSLCYLLKAIFCRRQKTMGLYKHFKHLATCNWYLYYCLTWQHLAEE